MTIHRATIVMINLSIVYPTPEYLYPLNFVLIMYIKITWKLANVTRINCHRKTPEQVSNSKIIAYPMHITLLCLWKVQSYLH